MNKLAKVLVAIAVGLVLLVLAGLILTLLPGLLAAIRGR
jgi:hypothetical protein